VLKQQNQMIWGICVIQVNFHILFFQGKLSLEFIVILHRNQSRERKFSTMWNIQFFQHVNLALKFSSLKSLNFEWIDKFCNLFISCFLCWIVGKLDLCCKIYCSDRFVR
jgi:hypothetical protein